MATQGERRRQTRAALLDAAAARFAERGIADSTVDSIALAAGRTSGAIYDHFGSKEGVLFALLEGWVDDVAAVLSAELVNAATLPERMAALWRNISSPAVGSGRWIALEHELWSYAVRNPAAMERLAERYRAAWARQLALVDERKTGAGADRVLVVEHPHVDQRQCAFQRQFGVVGPVVCGYQYADQGQPVSGEAAALVARGRLQYVLMLVCADNHLLRPSQERAFLSTARVWHHLAPLPCLQQSIAVACGVFLLLESCHKYAIPGFAGLRATVNVV